MEKRARGEIRVHERKDGQVTYSLPHQAKVVTDSAGTALFLEYKGRKVADV